MKEVVKKEVLKWLNAGFIYAISNSPWVSPIHMVPKKGGGGVGVSQPAKFSHAKKILQSCSISSTLFSASLFFWFLICSSEFILASS